MPDNPNLVSEEDLKGMEPVEVKTITPSIGPSAPPATPSLQPLTPLFSGSLAPQLQLDANFARASTDNSRIPKASLMPLGVNGNPSSNAGILSSSRSLTVAFPPDNDVVVTDGITHANGNAASTTLPTWWNDPAFCWLEDDFMPAGQPDLGLGGTGNVGPYGTLNWMLIGGAGGSSVTNFGGAPPNMGQVFIPTAATSFFQYSGLFMNWANDNAGHHGQAMALLENPGWRMTWIFKPSGALGTGSENAWDGWRGVSFYCGLSGRIQYDCFQSTTFVSGSNAFTPRPPCFLGLRWDTSVNPPPMTVQSFAASSGGNQAISMQYNNVNLNSTTNPGIVGLKVTIMNANNPANNGTFTIQSVTTGPTVITVNNPSGVAESGSIPEVYGLVRMCPQGLVCTAVAAASGGNTVYTVVNWNAPLASVLATFGNGQLLGYQFTVSGFANPNNNGTFTCVASLCTSGANTGTITLNNPNGVAVTAAGQMSFTAPSLAAAWLNDSSVAGSGTGGTNTFKFEYINNPSLQGNACRKNNQVSGFVFDTGITPAPNHWYRLDLACAVTGVVNLTLTDNTTGAQFTQAITVPKLTLPTGNSVSWNPDNTFGLAVQQVLTIGGVDFGTSGTHVSTGGTYPQIGPGTVLNWVSVSGGGSPMNGVPQVVEEHQRVAGPSSTEVYRWTPTAGVTAAATTGGSCTYYPCLGPCFIFGEDDTVGTSSQGSGQYKGIFIDYFSFIWNPNLGPNAPGTPNPKKARYF
jgi:hypothetical protein